MIPIYDFKGRLIGVSDVADPTKLQNGGYFGVEQEDISEPNLQDLKNSKVDDLLRSAGVSQMWQLDAALAGVLALARLEGLTEPQLYGINPGYRQIKDLKAQIVALESQL